MAKGKKKDKQTLGSSTRSKNSDVLTDPNFQRGNGDFILPNGDVYSGDFVAHRKGLLWREGRGTYFTQDGQVYEGTWYNDKLIEGRPVRASFAEGHEFVGGLEKNKYSGPGCYAFDNRLRIVCEFANNRPTGVIVLIDQEGHVHTGVAKDKHCLLFPQNVFYKNLNEERGKLHAPSSGLPERESTPVLDTQQYVETTPKFDYHRKIFDKSTKTKFNLGFELSDWYQDYLKFKEKKRRVLNHVGQSEHGEGDSSTWLTDYQFYKQLRASKKAVEKTSKSADIESSRNLLEAFNSRAYADSYPAVKVFYPSSNWDSFNGSKRYSGGCSSNEGDTKTSSLTGTTKNRERKISKVFFSSDGRRSSELGELSQTFSSIQPRPKARSKARCVDRRHVAESTDSLFNLVEDFLSDNRNSGVNIKL